MRKPAMSIPNSQFFLSLFFSLTKPHFSFTYTWMMFLVDNNFNLLNQREIVIFLLLCIKLKITHNIVWFADTACCFFQCLVSCLLLFVVCGSKSQFLAKKKCFLIFEREINSLYLNAVLNFTLSGFIEKPLLTFINFHMILKYFLSC